MGTAALYDLPLLADELQTIKLDTNFQNYDKIINAAAGECKDRARLTQHAERAKDLEQLLHLYR